MYRRILVPVDGSATSKAGLRHALGLAKDQNARVRVLNVVDEMAIAPMVDGYPADMTMLIDSMREVGAMPNVCCAKRRCRCCWYEHSSRNAGRRPRSETER